MPADDAPPELGPDADAIWARAQDVEHRYAGEGWSRSVGRDGEVWCVRGDSGTSLGLLEPDERDEEMTRRARWVRRFASREAMEAWLTAWEIEYEADAGIPPTRRLTRPGGSGPLLEPWSITLEFPPGQLGASARVVIGRAADGGTACGVRVEPGELDGPAVSFRSRVAPHEVRRLESELELLGVERWRDFGCLAMDGMVWRLDVTTGRRTVRSRGINAFPPDGAGRPTSEFWRMLLAVERTVGVRCWGGDPACALGSIPDAQARTDHTILAALRAWAAQAMTDGLEPAATTEPQFELALEPHLVELATGVLRQRGLSAKGDRAPVLPRWPNVGNVDIELREDGDDVAAAWVELKWVKRRGELGQCSWDAAKLAEALRTGVTRAGYLVACATEKTWAHEQHARRLFRSASFEGRAILEDFPDWWSSWLVEGAGVGLETLPTPIITTPVGRVLLLSPSGERWQIYVTRVSSPGNERVVVEADSDTLAR